ncbi:MAG TPA: hypothetical protein VFH92_04825, partial [Phenylobacterium sp.]|nr:hypothetical protein [Phenylobacterium sp.]
MSMDFDDREPVSSDNDSPLFGATPVWERGRKRRGFGARRPAETRTFAPAEEETPMTLDRPVERPGPDVATTNSTLAADAAAATAMSGTTAADESLVAPIGRERVTRTTTTRSRAGNSAAPAALIVGGVAALAVVAGVGWYATRGHEGVPEITPGAATSSSQVATAPVVPVQGPPPATEPERLAAAEPA